MIQTIPQAMTSDEQRRIRENLFIDSWPSVEPWDQFAWHIDRQGRVDTYVTHSSQALAIDLFGTIRESEAKDLIMTAIATNFGVQDSGPWEVKLEWKSPDNELREKRQTQVDAMAGTSRSLLLFECKFTERSGGCSQKDKLADGVHAGLRQCNGSHSVQTNPINKVTARCALTGKGIRYWDVIPRVLPFQSDQDHAPCPFSGERFQWMRNLTVAHEAASARTATVVAVYADHPSFKMAKTVRSKQWKQFADSVTNVRLRSISYQEIVALILKALPTDSEERAMWLRLQEWIDHKIVAVAGRQGQA